MAEDESWLDVGFMELSGLNTPWREVVAQGTRLSLPKGRWVRQERELFFLAQGKIRMVQQNVYGNEKILWHIGVDCVFGETPFFVHGTQITNFTCTTNCEVYSFPENVVRRLWAQKPNLLYNLAESMAYKIRMLSHQAASMCYDKIVVRACKFLAQNIVPGSEPLCAHVGMSQRDMANLLGINRITLYKILHNLRESGLVGPMREQRIEILNLEGLHEIVRNSGGNSQ